METPTTSFSKKCRNRVNEKFSKLRIILGSFFPDCDDWNRFRVIERALILLRGTSNNSSVEQFEPTQSMSNKEACALYRSKMNIAFEMLKTEVENITSIDAKKYRLFTRAGVLEAAIDAIGEMRQNFAQNFPPNRGVKRSRADSVSSISPRSDSVGSISPTHFSPTDFSPTQFCKEACIQRLLYFNMLYKMRAGKHTETFSEKLRKRAKSYRYVPETRTEYYVWRPWE